jgi:hypothetical protein
VRPGSQPSPLDAVDGDGDVLTYTVVEGTLPDGLVLQDDGTWTGAVLSAGVFQVTVRACDPYGSCAYEVLTLNSTSLPDTATAGPIETTRPSQGAALVAIGVFAFLLLVIATPRRRRQANRRDSRAS